MKEKLMNKEQYEIVKIFTDMKIPGQLPKIAKVFKIPVGKVQKISESYSFDHYQIPDKDRGYDFGSMFDKDNPFAGMEL